MLDGTDRISDTNKPSVRRRPNYDMRALLAPIDISVWKKDD